jgi:hypothetical protein
MKAIPRGTQKHHKLTPEMKTMLLTLLIWKAKKVPIQIDLAAVEEDRED